MSVAGSTSDRYPLPRDAWYVGVASTQLTDQLLAIRLHGEPILLYRDEGGSAHALFDRCPHRGVALSLGSKHGNTISCAYHGWRFGNSGACEHIPSLRAGQDIKQVSVRNYPTAEQEGYVWIWTGTTDPASSPLPIERFEEFTWLQGAVEMNCEAVLPIENNLDICHAAFTHPNQHPQWFRAQSVGLMPSIYAVETDAHSVEVRGSGAFLRFDLPDRVTVGTLDTFRLVLHHVPTTAGRCIQHWLLQRGPAESVAPPIWSDDEPAILAQDRRVLESAQISYSVESDRFERSVEADAPTLAVRRLLEAAQSGKELQTITKQVEVMS